MVEKSKKRQKGSIGEEDISSLLQRYSVKTVLTLLQEVAKVAGEKIDWNAVVQNTATGISSARECQVLWRHLAYGLTLTDQFDHAANPMDDDSDLEYELEAFPAVSRETSVEAAACVKVLIASDYPIDAQLPNNSTIEAPLTVNLPKFKSSTAPQDSSLLANAMQGTNISIPVSVQKQPLSSGACREKRPNNVSSGVNFPPRRKRRSWSTEDDVKLTAAVQRYGERNWATIARGDFMNDRKASELSQRWANLRKKQGNSNVGTSSQLSEAQLAAAHRAVSLALDKPPARQMNAVGAKSQHQSQKASAVPQDQPLGTAMPPKSQVPTARPSMNSDSMVKAAAVAAGARIATAADASLLIEAARTQNVVHIKSSTNHQLPSNVHFIRSGLAKAQISAYSSTQQSVSRPGEAQQAQSHSMESSVASESKELVQRDQADDVANIEKNSEGQSAQLSTQSKDSADKHRLSATGNALKGNTQGDHASIPVSDQIIQTQDDRGAIQCKRAEEDHGKKSADNLCTSKEIPEKPNPNDGSGEESTRNTTAAAGDQENKESCLGS